jgi:glycosyltransferase involved in cell wall biosynthesis
LRISIIIPMRDEGENVPPLAEEICEFINRNGWMGSAEVLFVDDNSEDDTYERIKSYSGRYPFIRAIRLNGMAGKGAAIKSGIWEAKGDVVVTMDGDMQHSPRLIPSLIKPIAEGGLDLVVAARVDGNYSPYRRILSKAFSWIFNALFGLRLTTPNEGFKAFRRDAISNLRVSANGFDFDIELLVKAKRMGLRIGEIPISLRNRLHGSSKVRTLKIIPLFLYRMAKLWLDREGQSA